VKAITASSRSWGYSPCRSPITYVPRRLDLILFVLACVALVGAAIWLACGDAAAPLFYSLGALGIGVLSGCVLERLGQGIPRFDFFVGAIGILLLIACATWRASGAAGSARVALACFVIST
jgi:hypothetical protein